jgi:hypothetical protein
VYLYHWPIFLWLTPVRTGLDGLALFGERMALTIAVAMVSYLWIEQPILARRWPVVQRGWGRAWRPAAVAAALAAAVAVVFVQVPSTSSAPKIVFSAVKRPADALSGPSAEAAPGTRAAPGTVDQAATLPLTGPASDAARSATTATVPATPTAAPVAPPPPPVQRILLVGDSVAQTLGRGLERWGPANGVTVVNAARFYCGVTRGGRIAMALGHSNNGCADWATRWPVLLDRVHPDVVVMLTTIWDVGARQRNEWGPDYLAEGDPRFDQWVVSEWRAAVEVLGSRGARVVWLSSPCAAEAPINEMLHYSNSHFIPALQSTSPAISVDLGSGVCPRGEFSDQVGPVANGRPDGMHFSDAGANWVASWLGPRLVDPLLGNEPVVASGHARLH